MGEINEIQCMSCFSGDIRCVAVIKARLLSSSVPFPTAAKAGLFR